MVCPGDATVLVLSLVSSPGTTVVNQVSSGSEVFLLLVCPGDTTVLVLSLVSCPGTMMVHQVVLCCPLVSCPGTMVQQVVLWLRGCSAGFLTLREHLL